MTKDEKKDGVNKIQKGIKEIQCKEENRVQTNTTYKFQCTMGITSRKAIEHLKFTKCRTALTEVEDSDGNITSDPDTIKEEVCKFYSNLYSYTEVSMDAGDKLVQMAHSELKQCTAKEAEICVVQSQTTKYAPHSRNHPKGNPQALTIFQPKSITT
ncbi:hypothetical protein DSO57_1032858 [Entomophthora muscae]|uniref:Uncharacterized protein n=1 Tax=Entomophthora muscae TaxID=34485 RepID=A0ACC2SDA9_9FUNG|nr:hypothetical protein DSO57_1032858 [Entomophthora muscae]